MNIVKKTITMGDGTIVEIETGKLAKQAAGSVVVKVGGMMLLATVTCAKDAKEDVDFMPLSVEYKEKYAAAGRYPGGFLKREGRASDSEILVARLVDRALRPLFPDDFHAEVFVNVIMISADKVGSCCLCSSGCKRYSLARAYLRGEGCPYRRTVRDKPYV